MAKTVRKLKRRSKDIKYTPTKEANRQTNEMDFSVNDLIAKLSENSKSSKNEMESIQKKLLQQANQILFGPKLMEKSLNIGPKFNKPLNVGPGKFENGRVNGNINEISEPIYDTRVLEPTQDIGPNVNGQINGRMNGQFSGPRLSDPTLDTNSRFSNGRLDMEPTHDTGPRVIEVIEPIDNNTQLINGRVHNNSYTMNPTLNGGPRGNSMNSGPSVNLYEVSPKISQEVGPRIQHEDSSRMSIDGPRMSREGGPIMSPEGGPRVLNGSGPRVLHESPRVSHEGSRLSYEGPSLSHDGPTRDQTDGPRVINATQKAVYGRTLGAKAFGTGSGGSAGSSRAAFTGTVSSVPPYRMPPAPEAALPGAPSAHLALNHSTKFPIEREVILSCGDVAKVPALQARRRPAAVAPDTPPKPHAAWHAENQQAGSSCEYRQYHDQYGYAVNQNQNQNTGAVSRNVNYDPKPPIPAKNTPNNSHITVTVETGKDSTRDAPKSNKSVSKTYHTLKDMISSRFKKDNNDSDKSNEEPRLNNTEERKRPEPENVTPRETPRKVEQGIYGRPMPQNRPDMQYNPAMANNMAYHSPSPHRQIMQQHIVQQQMMMSQARSQEMLASPHRQQALGADALYQQYGPPGRRSAVYQRDLDVRSMANFTSLKTGPQSQYEHSHSRADLRSPQQLEREIVRQRGFIEGRRASSHPHLLDEPQQRSEVSSPHTPQINNKSRRNSQGNLLDGLPNENGPPRHNDERESDDGGFRMRLNQSRSSADERIRSSGRSIESRLDRSQEYRRTPDSHRERRTPDSHKERRTPDSLNQRPKDESENLDRSDRTDENVSQKSVDSVYNASVKQERHTPQPSSSRQTPNRIEDLKSGGKKASGSAASSDYDKNGGQSSNVDSGRGSVAYSSGRRPETSIHDTSADSDVAGTKQPQPSTSQQNPAPAENEWADLVECELRQILEPKLSNMRLDSSDSSDSDVTPPLPPLSPSSDIHKRNSLPGRSSEYPEERRRGRESPRWHAHSHKKHSSKRDHHYKKHLFGLDTTDMTSTTTRSLDLSSLLDARSDARTDSDASGDARAIRRQLRGLENMYAEVLQLLGVRKPARPTPWEARLSSKRRYGSMSSLPSSSVSSRPVRDKRRSSHDGRKKHDLKVWSDYKNNIKRKASRIHRSALTTGGGPACKLKLSEIEERVLRVLGTQAATGIMTIDEVGLEGINKRFARLEAHVVTLARSVAHLSSEMRTQHLVMAEMDNIRAEIAALRHMYKSQQYIRSGHRHTDPFSFSNPDRVKRLTKFFGDEPPLMRLFLKKLGYEKYAALLEKEKVGAAELPYVGEDRLRALGVPLGPRMRILKEAGIHQDLHMQRDDMNTTTTTLAIV